MNAKEWFNEKAKLAGFEDEDSGKHFNYWLDCSDFNEQENVLLKWADEYETQYLNSITNWDIEKYFTTQHFDNKNGHHTRINKDRIYGAKAMRDGNIKPR